MRIILLLLLLCCPVAAPSVAAQETDEVVKVRTRVVFVDALVRDKRTGGVVADLKRENFEVLDEGRPRQLSYFSREDDGGRKPLALTLVLDLRREGSGRFLKRVDILDAISKELARLPAQDEVAVVVFGAGGAGSRREWLTKFTNDRAETARALARVPSLVERTSDAAAANPAPSTDAPQNDTLTEQVIRDSEALDVSGEVVTRDRAVGEGGETILRTVYKNGETVVRTIHADGRVRTTRTSKGGKVTADMEGLGLPLFSATAEAVRLKERERPASRAVVVWVSDGIDPVFHLEQRDATALLLRRNAMFNALAADMKLGLKLFRPLLQPLGNFAGVSIYNSAGKLARETGGVSFGVRRPEDYARGIGRIVSDLAGRYSLGFTLAEDEVADGRMRKLEVRVTARDEKGKRRKLEVAARRGYFVPGSN